MTVLRHHAVADYAAQGQVFGVVAGGEVAGAYLAQRRFIGLAATVLADQP